jgi:HEPN domain-containing protein
MVSRTGIDVPEDIRQADVLTQYAVETRYPGLNEEVSEEDYRRALELAERVLRWAEALIAR